MTTAEERIPEWGADGPEKAERRATTLERAEAAFEARLVEFERSRRMGLESEPIGRENLFFPSVDGRVLAEFEAGAGDEVKRLHRRGHPPRS